MPSVSADLTLALKRPLPNASQPRRKLRCAVPAGVRVQDSAFAKVRPIALHGFRLAEVGAGSNVAIGLGLLGQLATRLAMAAGCDVAGVDPATHARTLAEAMEPVSDSDRAQVTGVAAPRKAESFARWDRYGRQGVAAFGDGRSGPA
jgi:threonine dehydrogenase-like Zn-dependent dehydrogenase